MTKRSTPFSPEVRERAVRMVFDHQGEHGSQYGAIQSIASKIGCSARMVEIRRVFEENFHVYGVRKSLPRT